MFFATAQSKPSNSYNQVFKRINQKFGMCYFLSDIKHSMHSYLLAKIENKTLLPS